MTQVSNECKVEVQEEEYVESFRAVLMDVIHAWSKVRSLSMLCNMRPCDMGLLCPWCKRAHRVTALPRFAR